MAEWAPQESVGVLFGFQFAGGDEAFARFADHFLFAGGEALEHLLNGDALRFGDGGFGDSNLN